MRFQIPVEFPGEELLLDEAAFRRLVGGVGKTVSAQIKDALQLEKIHGRVSRLEVVLKLQRRAERRARAEMVRR